MPTTITSAGVTFTDTTTLTSATLVANSVGTTQITNGSVTAAKLGTTEQKQIAKAWVNFNGTLATPSVTNRNYNVSSVTKNGTGDYTVNFATAMTDANYSTIAFERASVDVYPQVLGLHRTVDPTISGVRVQNSTTHNSVLANVDFISVVVFGN